jgi:hypothetical protein
MVAVRQHKRRHHRANNELDSALIFGSLSRSELLSTRDCRANSERSQLVFSNRNATYLHTADDEGIVSARTFFGHQQLSIASGIALRISGGTNRDSSPHV